MNCFWHLTTLVALCLQLMPQVARACTRIPSNPRPVVPSDGSELPANMVAWIMSSFGADPSLHVWVDAPDGKTREVPSVRRELDPFSAPFFLGGFAEYRVTEALETGSTLRIGRVAEDAATEPQIFLRYKIVAEASMPSSMKLGEIEAQQESGLVVIGGVGAGGECSRELEDASFARIGLQLDAALKPFEPLLRYQLRIDDEHIWSYDDGQQKQTRFWTSSLGAGQDLVYVACHGELAAVVASIEAFRSPDEKSKMAVSDWVQALEPGEHRVRMVGLLPDDSELVSNEVVVDLRCAPVELAAEGGANDPAEERARPRPATTSGCGVVSGAAGGASFLRWFALVLALALRKRHKQLAPTSSASKMHISPVKF